MNKTYYCPCISQIDSRKRLDEGKYLPSQLSKPETCFITVMTNTTPTETWKDTASERLFERKIRLQLDNGKELLTRFVQSVIFDPEAGR